jgi:hypothetical protein
MSEHITRHALLESMFRAADITESPVANIFGNAQELRLAAFQLDRINMMRCNGVERYDPKLRRVMAEWTDKDEARAERIMEKNRARFLAGMAKCYGEYWRDFYRVEFNCDPRGAPCKVFAAKDDRALFVVY